MKNTYHRDGTVTYWSVYQQQWISHAAEIPDQELAAMSGDERARVLRHLGDLQGVADLYWDTRRRDQGQIVEVSHAQVPGAPEGDDGGSGLTLRWDHSDGAWAAYRGARKVARGVGTPPEPCTFLRG